MCAVAFFSLEHDKVMLQIIGDKSLFFHKDRKREKQFNFYFSKFDFLIIVNFHPLLRIFTLHCYQYLLRNNDGKHICHMI